MGRGFPSKLAFIPSKTSEGTFTLASIIDITERKRAESDRERLAAIVESSEDAIISSTLDGVITSWNHGAERLFGYTSEAELGRELLVHSREAAVSKGGIHLKSTELHAGQCTHRGVIATHAMHASSRGR
jgi:PAS domain-containing protein